MKFYLLIIAAVLIQGCKNADCKKVKFGSDDLKWFKAYTSKSALVFESEANKFDTCYVKTMDRMMGPCNNFELGPIQSESFTISFHSKLRNDNFFIKFDSGEYTDCSKKIWVYDLMYCGNKIIGKVPEVNVFVPYIGDSVLTYQFDQSNSKSIKSGNIKSFNWSVKHGLVRYETDNNEVFELIRKRY